MTRLSLSASRALARRHVTSAGRIAEQALTAALADYGVEPGRAAEAVRAEIAHGSLRRVTGDDGKPALERAIQVGRIDASKLTKTKDIRSGKGVHVGKWPPPPGCACSGCARRREAA